MARRLVDTFGRGWARQDAELLLSVFSDAAVFREGPFGKAHEGLAAIRGYWADISYHQSEGTFSSGEIFTAGPWFSVEFKWVRSNDPSDSIQGMGRGNVKVHFQFIPRLQKKMCFK